MESFSWEEQFATGIGEIDEQHQRLVDILNRYGSALAENSLDQEYLYQIFRELAVYAREHFNTEEKIMIAARIDQRHVKQHIREHRSFVEDIEVWIKELDPEDPYSHRTILDFLMHWLTYHILGIDKMMARQVKGVMEGLSAEEVFRREQLDKRASHDSLLKALGGLFELVSKRNKELLELNLTLEKKVEERTKKLVEANRKLKLISITDDLTQLPNRRFAMQQIQLYLKEGEREGKALAVLMIDADGFKKVNDTYGHDAGDRVLKRLARKLRHIVRTDDIVCRLGGDEFLVICPDTNLQGATQLGEQIQAAVAKMSVTAGEGRWSGSVSIGVAVAISGDQQMRALLKSADRALYCAKIAGRNCVRSGAIVTA
ncbi:MAG: GGDEF domain-containing protein [Proteobacteria bacterium]|nr:MAG: GGDEF domain-containing protein [Pseudomonadota bacterium]